MRVPCELDRQLACRRMLLGARSSRASARRRDGGKEQMDFVVGVKGRDFAVVCADAQFTFSVLNQRHQVDKLLELDSHHVMGITGDMGDSIHFGEFIKANLHLYKYRNGRSLDTHAIGNFTRSELATALRRGPFLTNMVIAGFDSDTNEPCVYWLDYLAMLHKVNAAGHGYGSMFIKSILDNNWHENMQEDEALQLVRTCIREIQTRFVAAPSCYVVKVVDANGVRTAASIQSEDVDASS